jgi:toxin ParE1/3/4
MKYRLVVTEDAELDIEDAMDWYENEQKGLGRKYLNSVTDCFKAILKNPLAFATIFLKIRKANTKKFPYSVFYQIGGNEVIVFAVIHSHRSEKRWKERIV